MTRMWQMKTEIIPVVVGALGVITKGSEKLVRQIPGNIKLWKIQKKVLLGTAHILRKALSIKWQQRQNNPQVPQVQGLDPAFGEEIRSHELNINNNNNNNNNDDDDDGDDDDDNNGDNDNDDNNNNNNNNDDDD